MRARPRRTGRGDANAIMDHSLTPMFYYSGCHDFKAANLVTPARVTPYIIRYPGLKWPTSIVKDRTKEHDTRQPSIVTRTVDVLHLRPLADNVLDGGEGRTDASVVRDGTTIKRHVEVAAHQHPATKQTDTFNEHDIVETSLLMAVLAEHMGLSLPRQFNLCKDGSSIVWSFPTPRLVSNAVTVSHASSPCLHSRHETKIVKIQPLVPFAFLFGP